MSFFPVRSCFIIVTLINFVLAELQPNVSFNGSTIYGVTQNIDQTAYSAFLGIRYGKAPIGNLRFSKSELEPLPREMNATAMGPHCYPVEPDPKANEDCLFLNVYTPMSASGSKSKLPVIFYIHGGGNIVGNLDEKPGGGHLAVSGDVIVVTTNYRLGPLGFLSTGTSDAPGNIGFWDQNLALTWVSQYIQYFGGDPCLITLIGESAGGKAVSLHTVSPYSKSMVRRAVMESGSLYGPSLYAWDAPEAARLVALRVGCPRSTVADMISCLREKPAGAVATAGNDMWPDSDVKTLLDFGWGAVLDGDFIPPLENISGTFQGEVMLGLNNNEGTLLGWRFDLLNNVLPGAREDIIKCDNFKAKLVNQSLYQFFHTSPPSKAIDETYEFYIHCNENHTVPALDFMTLYADMQYLAPAIRYLKEEISRSKSYLYYFDHNIPKYDMLDKEYQGSHHADDQRYIMGAPPTDGYSPEIAQREIDLSKVMMTYLSNFAKSGNPNVPAKVPVPFPVYETKGDQQFLHLNSAILDHKRASGLVDSEFLPDRMELWLDKLPPLMQKSARSEGSSNGSYNIGQAWNLAAIGLVAGLVVSSILLYVLDFQF